MKVILEIEYPNDKIFEADTLPTRIADLNHGIYFEGDAKIVKAIPIETIKKEIERLKEDIKWAWYYGNTALDKMEYLKMWLEIKLEEWEKENEID